MMLNPKLPKTRLGKCLSGGFSISQEPSPVYPKSDGARHAQYEKASDAKRRPFLQTPRRTDCPALFADISPVACPDCVAHLKGDKNIITYA